jgi:hypothetical protein
MALETGRADVETPRRHAPCASGGVFHLRAYGPLHCAGAGLTNNAAGGLFDCAHPWEAIGMPRGLRGEKRPADVIGGLGPSSDR